MQQPPCVAALLLSIGFPSFKQGMAFCTCLGQAWSSSRAHEQAGGIVGRPCWMTSRAIATISSRGGIGGLGVAFAGPQECHPGLPPWGPVKIATYFSIKNDYHFNICCLDNQGGSKSFKRFLKSLDQLAD